MADLDQKERGALAASDFALPSRRELPIQDARHARLAWDMVDRTEGLSDAEKTEARSRIKGRLAELGSPLKEDAGDGKGDEDGRVDAADGVDSIFFLPITRIDQDRREVEGVATSEAVDTFGTVFDYEASKAAFAAWGGIVREMHQPKAVGRKAEVCLEIGYTLSS